MQSRGLTCGAAAVLAVAFALAAAGVGAVQEQESEDGRAQDDRALRRLPAFGALDTDDDGEISALEIDAAAESLATLDEDGDGQLSEDELRPRGGGPIGVARTPPEATAAFMRFDADEDGLLERTELTSQFVSLLTRADADGDGAASEAEILALLTAEAEPPPEPERPESEAREEGPTEAGEPQGRPRPRNPLMAALDPDGDGTVSASEIGSAARSVRSLDADGDGRLAIDELRPSADDEPDGESPRE